MAKSYAKATATLAAGVAISIAALLTAEGYTGSMVGKYMAIDALALLDLFRGADSDASSSTGIAVPAGVPYIRTADHPTLAIDPENTWVISPTGGDIALTFEAF